VGVIKAGGSDRIWKIDGTRCKNAAPSECGCARKVPLQEENRLRDKQIREDDMTGEVTEPSEDPGDQLGSSAAALKPYRGRAESRRN